MFIEPFFRLAGSGDPQTSRPSATVARALFHVATATVGSDQITRYTRQICDVMSYEHIKDFGVR